MGFLTEQIERRLVLHLRTPREVVPRWVDPWLVGESALGGILVDRVKALGPLGLGCERISYFWLARGGPDGESPERVVWRQVSTSRVDCLLAASPSVRFAEIDVVDTPERIAIRSRETGSGWPLVLWARPLPAWPTNSVFSSARQAACLAAGGDDAWDITPLWIEKLQPGPWCDPAVVARGLWDVDSGLVLRRVDMGRIPHEVRQRGLRLVPHMPLACWGLARDQHSEDTPVDWSSPSLDTRLSG